MSEAVIECIDCGKEFTVTQGEAAFLREKFGKNFSMPRRCKPCRQSRKEKKVAAR